MTYIDVVHAWGDMGRSHQARSNPEGGFRDDVEDRHADESGLEA
jgi:hypothetical protein